MVISDNAMSSGPAVVPGGVDQPAVPGVIMGAPSVLRAVDCTLSTIRHRSGAYSSSVAASLVLTVC